MYLPSSSVCCQLEPIPFHITLFADERTLEPFAEYRPMPSSFLPISGSPSYASFESVHTHFSARKAAHKCPLKIKALRTTIVDAGSAGLGFALRESQEQSQSRSGTVRDLFSRSDVSYASFASGRSRAEKASMHSAHAIGQGVVHSANGRAKSVVWSGAIIIPPCEEGFSGGFEINGLKVVVSPQIRESTCWILLPLFLRRTKVGSFWDNFVILEYLDLPFHWLSQFPPNLRPVLYAYSNTDDISLVDRTVLFSR